MVCVLGRAKQERGPLEDTALFVRLDLSGQDAAIGLKEAFDLDFGANSDRPVILFDDDAICNDDDPIGDNPGSEELIRRQPLNDSFEFGLILCEAGEGHSERQHHCQRNCLHAEESSVARALAVVFPPAGSSYARFQSSVESNP